MSGKLSCLNIRSVTFDSEMSCRWATKVTSSCNSLVLNPPRTDSSVECSDSVPFSGINVPTTRIFIIHCDDAVAWFERFSRMCVFDGKTRYTPRAVAHPARRITDTAMTIPKTCLVLTASAGAPSSLSKELSSMTELSVSMLVPFLTTMSWVGVLGLVCIWNSPLTKFGLTSESKFRLEERHRFDWVMNHQDDDICSHSESNRLASLSLCNHDRESNHLLGRIPYHR